MRLIEQALRNRIGLDAASIGTSTIQRVVRLRMKELGLKQLEGYNQLLASSQAEWDELVESVLVTETWFFRDQEPFAAFIRLVFEGWMPHHPAGLLRVLSLPCSSGEEPYSLVMALLDAGLPPERFQIDGIDLSHRAIAKATSALYTRNSFRGKEMKHRERYFQTLRDGYLLNAPVRNMVRFSQGNVLDDDFLTGKPTYDFIFCRNLLIYFDRPTQDKALQRVSQLLSPSGVLFVGPAEQPLVTDRGFISTNIPMAFACLRAPAAVRISPRRSSAKLTRSLALPSLSQVNLTELPLPPRLRDLALTGDRPSTAEAKLPDLDEARRLADSGSFKEAAAICEAYLVEQRTSAQAYFLLGLVRDASGDATAMDCYRKALYLEPTHYETLVQMALIAEKNGDALAALNFRRRAQRASSVRPRVTGREPGRS